MESDWQVEAGSSTTSAGAETSGENSKRPREDGGSSSFCPPTSIAKLEDTAGASSSTAAVKTEAPLPLQSEQRVVNSQTPPAEPICPLVGELPPPPPTLVPRSAYVFVPKCGHRHPLKRHPRGVGDSADEPLLCDGACNTLIQPSDPRWSCHPCDFDLCELCLLSQSGGAAYLGLLSAEEKVSADLRSQLTQAEERARAAEKRAEGKAVTAVEKKSVEAKLAAAEERATAAEAEVARLNTEVAERRLRSKANLEKMYAARKERDEAQAQIGASEEAASAKLAAQAAELEAAVCARDGARQQLACAFGEEEAMLKLSSEELQQLESLSVAGLAKIHERRVALAQSEERERQRHLDCAVCLAEPRGVAFAPCGHIACCRTCAPKIDACPLCKRGVAQRVAIFLP